MQVQKGSIGSVVRVLLFKEAIKSLRDQETKKVRAKSRTRSFGSAEREGTTGTFAIEKRKRGPDKKSSGEELNSPDNDGRVLQVEAKERMITNSSFFMVPTLVLFRLVIGEGEGREAWEQNKSSKQRRARRENPLTEQKLEAWRVGRT